MSAKEKRRIGGITLIVLQFAVGQVFAAEWETSNGDHCITACKFHDDGNLYHWCTTAFGREPDMSRKWDYCTPSEFSANPGVTQQDPEDEGQADIGDSAPSRPEFGGRKTALYHQTDCKTSCVKGRLDAEESYTCDTDTDNTFANVDVGNNNQTWFYCAREQDLNRNQLSAQHKLWCVDDCKRNDTAQGYTCNTLYGPDLCSPGEGKTVSGSQCSSPCALDDGEEYYSCYTDEDESTWEYCGFHDAPEEKKGVLEFTVDDVVCADYCSKKHRGGDHATCSVVEWHVYKGKADLMLSWNYCRGEDPPLNSGTVIGICIFLVGLSIPSIAILYASCCYDRNKDVMAERARNRAVGTKGEGMEEKNLTSV